MKKRILISTILATVLFASTTLYAKSTKDEVNVAQSSQLSIDKESKKQKEAFKQAPKEIVEGFNQTLKAIEALENSKNDTAKKALKKATENFNTALKNAPELDLVPLSQEIVVHEFLGNSSSVKKSLTLAKNLLEDYDTQTARVVLMPLEDEMIVTTDSIPMKLYPLATKDALKALEKGDKERALELLTVSLNTIASETVLMPLPLLVAEDLVVGASVLDKENKKDALALLTLAQDELKKAVYLGYTKKHSKAYKALEEEIESVKEEIKGKNIVEKFYDKVKNSFHGLVSKIRGDVVHEKAQEEVRTYENKEAHKAINVASKFTTDAKVDEAKTVK